MRGDKLLQPQTLSIIVEDIPGVSEFQVVQEKEDEFIVYVVKMEEFRDNMIIEKINRGFKKVLGDNIFLNIKFVGSIPRAPSGKLRSVISRL
jgi:phenylacetate-CoA ligase